MPQERVVITGMGIISSLGDEIEPFWQALLAGKSGIVSITRFDTSQYDVRIGGEVRDFDPTRWMEEREARKLDRCTQFGMAAAVDAVKGAAIDFQRLDRSRVGVIIGLGIGGLSEMEEQHKKLFEKGPSRVSPFFIPKLMMNAVPGQISIRYNLSGPNFSVASACASSNHAMGLSLQSIRRGECDIVITGGCEAALTPSGLAGFVALRALSPRNSDPEKASRPFEKSRDGFVLAEGSGILIFESLRSAIRREGRILAEVKGFGMSADAHHITAPDPDGQGAGRAMQSALQDAKLRPEEISYINAHGTSTPLNDAVETRAIRKIFGPHADRIPVSATKSMTGHSLGAAGAIELIACAMSILQDKVHPTINYEVPDPECDLDYVPNVCRSIKVENALSNSFGFGGHNASIVVGKYRP